MWNLDMVTSATVTTSKSTKHPLLLIKINCRQKPITETYTNNKEDPIIESILDFNQKEIDSLKNNVNYGRIAMSFNEDQKYMMAFVWVNPKELYLLQAFPEVIMIDTTDKTINKKRPLVTAGRKY